jgi:hypothetical protein
MAGEPPGLSGALLVAYESSTRILWGPTGFLGSSLLECGSSVKILWISIEESLLESLICIEIPACRNSHDITSEWMICQS